MNLAASQWFLKSIVWSPNTDEKQKNISRTSIPVIAREIFCRWSIDLLTAWKSSKNIKVKTHEIMRQVNHNIFIMVVTYSWHLNHVFAEILQMSIFVFARILQRFGNWIPLNAHVDCSGGSHYIDW